MCIVGKLGDYLFTAIYLPSRPEGVEDPSRSGFATKEEAEEFVAGQMCNSCKEERSRALANLYDPEIDLPW